jgi:predicted lipid carrier protein YhbT
MVRFLSDAWVAAMDDAAATVTVPPEVAMVVDQTVTDARSEVRYHLVVADGRIAVRRGPAEDAQVSFRQDLVTAWAIASGRASAQRAFMAGHLRVGGDLNALVANRDVFTALDQATASVRDRTEPPDGLDATEADDA